MSSYCRTYYQRSTPTLEYMRLTGPYYQDSLVGYTLIPFTYRNGVLDIALIDNVSGYTGAPLQDNDIGLYTLPLYKSLGGAGLVTSLGTNFLNYIKAWRSIVAGSPVTQVSLVTNPVMIKVQRSSKSTLYSGTVYRVGTSPPSGDTYVDGDATNLYSTSWVFKKPLTIQTIENGVAQYITLTTTLY